MEKRCKTCGTFIWPNEVHDKDDCTGALVDMITSLGAQVTDLSNRVEELESWKSDLALRDAYKDYK